MTDLLTWLAPDVDDHTARHQRGAVRLHIDLGEDGRRIDDLVPAWVCCDPMCGGVELSEAVLDINHGCCEKRCCCPDHRETAPLRRGRHTVGLGRRNFTGHHHGPFTEHWLPSAENNPTGGDS